MFRYHNPVEIHYVPYSLLETLVGIIEPNQNKKVTLIFGQHSARASGIIDKIKTKLSLCHVTELGGVIPNPSLKDIEKIREIQAKNDEWVVGIGGGSVLDTAKIYSASRKRHFVAIPTTSGTGSEVTPWATVWDFDSKEKKSFVSGYPEYAIIDPTLTLSLPIRETAYTGFDALSHALESYWSIHANPISDMYALKAIGLIFSNLYLVCYHPEDMKYRSAMSLASLYAGLAFSNTKTTAVHSVSYPMTLHYEIPHGIACSLLLPSFCRYNLDNVSPEKIQKLSEQLKIPYGRIPYEIYRLSTRLGLPKSLKEAGIPEEGIEIITQEGFHPDRVHNNPRELTKPALRSILEDIYE